MNLRLVFFASATALLLGTGAAFAQSSVPSEKPQPYAKFVAGLTPQRGLFTIWRNEGKVYLELTKGQLDTDFIQSFEPATGLGGFGLTPGLPYVAFARVVRFSRQDDKVAITWPNTSFVAPEGSPAARAVAQSFAPSVVALAPIAAVDDANGSVVIDASAFLGDLMDLQNYLRLSLHTTKHPESAYHLDPARSYFGPTKAFPDNVIVEADQTFESAEPALVDNVPDARSLQIHVKYNIFKAPEAGSYMPRIADDRVGYYPDILLDFGSDRVTARQLRYALRWNLQRHPMVYYISNTIPFEYRATIKSALLTWNDAFAKIGFPNAVEVRDQPDDPAWDEDDIRYNTIHWLTLSNGGGYAQAGIVYDPRTGEIVKASIVIDSDLVRFGSIEGQDVAAPMESHGLSHEAAYARGMRATAGLGLWALRAMDEIPGNAMPPNYVEDFLRSIVLHESGHTWGLQHNFIGSQAYSAKQLQSKEFTSKFGVATTVMEYSPVNLWPKGTPNGNYWQLVLGPYDYYAIKWGYAVIPGAKTPGDELATLGAWASAWADPMYRYANDEDVEWNDGHAIDPRTDQWDLTNDNLAWCGAQFAIVDRLWSTLDGRLSGPGATHDAQRQAFEFALFPYEVCSQIASHYVGGEYLARAHAGDPRARFPLDAVPLSRARDAFAMLDRYVFSARAWRLSPKLLRQLVYTEWVTDFQQAPWQYAPPVRHDEPIVKIAGDFQSQILERLFSPVLLQRLDDLGLKYPAGTTMSLADLFTWTHRSVFGDLGTHATVESEVHRNLQQWYARKLAAIVLAPAPGTPYDAQSLARADLTELRAEASRAQERARDTLVQAHLAALRNVADQALNARTVLPITPGGGSSDGGT